MEGCERLLRGKKGEMIAEEYLCSIGLVTLERNWRSGHKEIDLIMTGKEILHIVEVKSLNFPGLQGPYESVNLKKQNIIISAARDYVVRKRVKYEIQFDIVSVLFKGDDFIIEYFPDAFAPRW